SRLAPVMMAIRPWRSKVRSTRIPFSLGKNTMFAGCNLWQICAPCEGGGARQGCTSPSCDDCHKRRSGLWLLMTAVAHRGPQNPPAVSIFGTRMGCFMLLVGMGPTPWEELCTSSGSYPAGRQPCMEAGSERTRTQYESPAG